MAAAFGAAHAGAAFVPVNPLLKPEQVGHILRDCNVRVLVTSARPPRCHRARRWPSAPTCARSCVTGDAGGCATPTASRSIPWSTLCRGHRRGRRHRVIDTDMAAILYTSGSTGKPKGVVLSHRNMVAGAKSVASYLENTLGGHAPVRAAAFVRRRLQPAHDGVPRRRARRAAQLPAAARRARCAGQGARHRPHRRAAAVDPARAARVARRHRRAPALHRQHRRPHAARDAGRSCAAELPRDASPF